MFANRETFSLEEIPEVPVKYSVHNTLYWKVNCHNQLHTLNMILSHFPLVTDHLYEILSNSTQLREQALHYYNLFPS